TSRPASTPGPAAFTPGRATTPTPGPPPLRPAVMALACAAAWGSHVLLDWLGTDRTPPSGVTALWPFSSAYYYSALDIFPAVDRRYWVPGFLYRAFISIVWELVVLLPITGLVLWLRAPAPRKGKA